MQEKLHSPTQPVVTNIIGRSIAPPWGIIRRLKYAAHIETFDRRRSAFLGSIATRFSSYFVTMTLLLLIVTTMVMLFFTVFLACGSLRTSSGFRDVILKVPRFGAVLLRDLLANADSAPRPFPYFLKSLQPFFPRSSERSAYYIGYKNHDEIRRHYQ